MRVLAVIGFLAIMIGIAGLTYFFGGFYNVAAWSWPKGIAPSISEGSSVILTGIFRWFRSQMTSA